MKIALDTNILVSDFSLESPHFRVLLDGLSLLPASLHIPEIVIDETVNKFREILDEKLKLQNKTDNEILRMLRKGMTTLNLVHSGRETRYYKEYLEQKLKSANATILPYPKISHKEVIAKVLSRQKPFKKGDAGYRDFLIWESIRHLEVFGTEEIVFMTNNTADFGTGPFLPDDLEGKLTSNKNFKIYLSVSKFNEEHIKPRLKKLDQLKEKLAKEQIQNFDFKDWLNKTMLSLLNQTELEGIIDEYPYGISKVKIADIIMFNDYSIEEVIELPSGDKLVKYVVDLKIDASIDVDWNNYINRESAPKTGNHDSFYTHITENITVKGNLILSATDLKIVSEEIIFIKGPYGSISMES